MNHYNIDFYENDEFVIGYTLSANSLDIAEQIAKQELYLDGYPADYYVAYSKESKESKEGWIYHG